MVCRTLHDGDGKPIGILCGPRPRQHKCAVCGEPGADRQCDGLRPDKKSGTCDAWIHLHCGRHENGDKDFCPKCDAAPQLELVPAAETTSTRPTMPCAVCQTVAPRTYYWGNGAEGTSLCKECGAAWEASPVCVQQNPAASVEQCEADFLKWCDGARARLKKSAPEKSQCSTCHASIYWAVNPATGKTNPIDAEPSPKGNVLLAYRPRSGRLEATYITKDTPLTSLEGRRRYQSHFATCAQAKQHRRTA